MKFSSADEVEFVFEITLTSNQWLMVQNYIIYDVRPPAGCGVCDEGYIRVLTGRMDEYVKPADWPWSGDGSELE
jgi:hypothetical protein